MQHNLVKGVARKREKEGRLYQYLTKGLPQIMKKNLTLVCGGERKDREGGGSAKRGIPQKFNDQRGIHAQEIELRERKSKGRDRTPPKVKKSQDQQPGKFGTPFEEDAGRRRKSS